MLSLDNDNRKRVARTHNMGDDLRLMLSLMFFVFVGATDRCTRSNALR